MSDERRRLWEREYAELHAYTTSYRMDVDRGTQFLAAFLEGVGSSPADPIVECGCGMGRNLLPLALAGHRVVGLDHAETALEAFRERAVAAEVSEHVELLRHDLREPLPLADGTAGSLLDVTAIDNLVEAGDRRRYADELARVLRPGGWLLVVTFSWRDGYYRRWLPGSPGPPGPPGAVEAGRAAGGDDPLVVTDPNTGIVNQLFTGRSLDETFPEQLQRRAAATLVFRDEAAGERTTRHFLLRTFCRTN